MKYTLGLKNSQNCFRQNFVKFPPTLTIFGTKMAKTMKLRVVHSFSISPNLWVADHEHVNISAMATCRLSPWCSFKGSNCTYWELNSVSPAAYNKYVITSVTNFATVITRNKYKILQNIESGQSPWNFERAHEHYRDKLHPLWEDFPQRVSKQVLAPAMTGHSSSTPRRQLDQEVQKHQSQWLWQTCLITVAKRLLQQHQTFS